MSETPQSGYFINESRARGDGSGSAGYWEPHTSSIDFCETNYLLSDVLVEPHNVWSSLVGIALVGFLGILCGNPTREMRFSVIYSVLLVIGLGSAGLHASLHWFFQSFDELPMIYLIVAGFYAVLEADTPRGKTRHPNLARNLVLLCGVDTAIYYAFQHLYIIFLVNFSGITVGLMYFHLQIAWRLHRENKDPRGKNTIIHENNAIALRFYIWHYVAFLAVAIPIWFLDQFGCGHFLPFYNGLPFPLQGMTLHVVWHICAGVATHLFVQFLCACRASVLGMTCETRWAFGLFPVVVTALGAEDVKRA